MQFIYDGNMCKIVRITSPSHNVLGLVLKKNGKNSDLEVLDIENSHSFFKPETVKSQVLEGLNEANKEFATNFKIVKIEFSSKDTPSETIYGYLTKEIIGRVIENNVKM